METARASVLVVAAVVVTTSLVSGPLVGAVDLTPEPGAGPPPGSGNVTVTVESVPGTATLRPVPGGEHQLRVPPATVDVRNVSGQPLLVYKIRIRAIGFTRGTTQFLDASAEGRGQLELEPTTTELPSSPPDEYRGELLILTRSDAGERKIYRGNVTVEVVG